MISAGVEQYGTIFLRNSAFSDIQNIYTVFDDPYQSSIIPNNCFIFCQKIISKYLLLFSSAQTLNNQRYTQNFEFGLFFLVDSRMNHQYMQQQQPGYQAGPHSDTDPSYEGTNMPQNLTKGLSMGSQNYQSQKSTSGLPASGNLPPPMHSPYYNNNIHGICFNIIKEILILLYLINK